MAELLARRLPVTRCHPQYVRYSPGRRCHVLYQLELGNDDTGRTIRTRGHLTLLRPRRAEKIWSRLAASGLVEQAAALHPAAFAKHAFLLPELGAVMQLEPLDLKLPALIVATSPSVMEPALGPVRAPEIVRYKPGRRAVLRYRREEPQASALYGKLRADSHGGRHIALARELIAQGISTPAPRAYLPHLRMTLHGEAPGTRLAELRSSHDFAGWMEPVADALSRLHATSAPHLPAYSPEHEVADLRAAAQVAAVLLPGRRGEIDRLAARLAAELAAVQLRAHTIHGSFHDDQVLVGQKGVVLLDLDSAALGHPLLDVGHFLSYLSAADENRARERFLEACAHLGTEGPETLLFEAASLVRWSSLPFRVLAPDWPEAVAHRLELARSRLADYERSRGGVGLSEGVRTSS